MNPFQNRKIFLNKLAEQKPSNFNKVSITTKMIVCKSCNNEVENTQIRNNSNICPLCGYYFPLSARRRLEGVFDNAKYKELFSNIVSNDPLSYPNYEEKIQGLKDNTGLKESVVCAVGEINNVKTAVAVMDTRFLMGSLGSATGERITQLFEYATRFKMPVVIFTASGGARMQEGIYSLFQMAKTASALKAHSDKGLLYITVLTNPTTGGVTASFASLGDVIIAEPKALVAFAGPRVIEQTIRQKLPEGFQTAEYVLDSGFIDMIVKRDDMKYTLGNILKIHSYSK